MTSAAFAGGDLQVGHILNRGYAVFLKHPVQFVAVTAIAMLPFLVLFGDMYGKARGGQGHAPMAWFFLPYMYSLLPAVVAQAFVLYGAFHVARDKPVHAGDSLRIAWEHFIALIVLAVFQALAIGVGTVIFIIPGLFVAAMLFVSVPALIVEQLGPFTAMFRSAHLTTGHRWKTVGIFLALTVIGVVVGGVVELILGFGGRVLAAIGAWVWYSIWGAYYAVVVNVTYQELRQLEGGFDVEQVGSELDAHLAA
ncbi:MAG TPA: hypothetical protein VGR91_01355 [Stellaceae bacterium]|nr:hypothetical protein [Stellaceae bacterium]